MPRLQQMQGSRWSEARDALLEIAEHALQQNSDEIDLRFLNSPLLSHGVKVLCFTYSLLQPSSLIVIQGAGAIKSIFDQVQPKGLSYVVVECGKKALNGLTQGRTPTGATLDKALNDHMTRLDETVNTPQYYNLKPLDIIILTDGIPSIFFRCSLIPTF